jgi:hypothetical protein
VRRRASTFEQFSLWDATQLSGVSSNGGLARANETILPQAYYDRFLSTSVRNGATDLAKIIL